MTRDEFNNLKIGDILWTCIQPTSNNESYKPVYPRKIKVSRIDPSTIYCDAIIGYEHFDCISECADFDEISCYINEAFYTKKEALHYYILELKNYTYKLRDEIKECNKEISKHLKEWKKNDPRRV